MPKSPFPKEVYSKNAEIYKLLANPIRLEILNIIKNNEVNVDELSKIIGIRKANTSQHLAVLRHLKVVKIRRDGKNTFYKITDPRIVEPCRILKDLWAKRSVSS
jgi:ArsR family transcriptional regulator, zinc-responsive transcriptional repressor